MPATRPSGTLLSFPQRKRTYHILLSSITVISKDIILYEYQRQVKKEQKLKDHRANKGEYKLASSEQRRSGGSGGGGGNLPPVVFINTSFKEFAMNNAWHIEIVNPDLTGTVKVHAECLKLVPE